MISAIAVFGFWALMSPFVAIVGFPAAWLTGDAALLYRFGMWVGGTALRLGGIRVRLTGRENIPERSCIFMCNHVSNLDPPVLFPALPRRVSILLKRSLMSVPLLGPAMRLARFVPIDREQRDSAIQSIRDAKQVLDSGMSLAVFPEGTRSRDGHMLPFKKGPFYLAEQTGVPVVPISLHGTEAMLRKGHFRIYPATAHVTIHPAVEPSQFATREELMAAVRESIASGLPKWMSEPSRPETT